MHFFYKLASFVTRNFYKLIFKVEVIGKENIPKEGPAIICSNHKSNFDPIAATCLTSKRIVHFMGKKELFDTKFKNYFMHKMLVFPVDRQGNDLKAIKHAMRILKDGDVLGMFPEGTRTPEMDLSKAKSGVTMIAIKAKVPIIPIYIESDYEYFKPLKVTVKEPITYEEYYGKKLTQEDYKALSRDVLKKIYGVEG